MKIGVRTPSLSKSLKARTTGRIKRQMKRAVNPLYGKKGMGFITNPEKAIYNKVYHKVTVDPLKGVKSGPKKRKSTSSQSTQRQATVSRPNPVVYKTVTYTCNKWIYISLAFFLGIVGAQFFYSGQKKKGFLSLLFFFTTVPIFIGVYQAFVALFKKADENGNITIEVKQKGNKYQFISEFNRIKRLLDETENLEPVLKTTLEPSEYVETLGKMAGNLNQVTEFSKANANNPNFDARSMAGGLEKMANALEEEGKAFIVRYHAMNPTKEGKDKLDEYLGYFSPEAVSLANQLYK
ncbi:TM2 domain-containing protein [Streptococcus gordonii]|uniref:TM2 domain-containing protein n=1 Tax=Streptococcus gordonii TaxID=1302 RepID=UPI002000AB27|nr:TM2 domain-containing protein [Streptococcus gordonii]